MGQLYLLAAYLIQIRLFLIKIITRMVVQLTYGCSIPTQHQIALKLGLKIVPLLIIVLPQVRMEAVMFMVEHSKLVDMQKLLLPILYLPIIKPKLERVYHSTVHNIPGHMVVLLILTFIPHMTIILHPILIKGNWL